MIVVCDTSPLNYLVLIGEIDLLPRLFAEVILTPGVLAELQYPRTPAEVAAWARDLPPWVRVVPPERPIATLGLLAAEAKIVNLDLSIRRLLQTNFRASPALIADILSHR